MGVGDEHEVNIGEMMMGEAGVAQATDHEEPVGPVRVHEDISVRPLDQERGVANPGKADLSVFEFGEDRGGAVPVAPFSGKEGGQQNIGDKAMGALPARSGCLCLQGRKDCPRGHA